MVRGIPVITTGTRVHRSDEHERTRIFHRIFRTADSYLAVFEGLTKHFEGRLVELWQFIEKEYAIVRHAHFARQGPVAATGHRHL